MRSDQLSYPAVKLAHPPGRSLYPTAALLASKFLADHEPVDQGHQAEAVPGKGREADAPHQPDEHLDGRPGRDERNREAHGEKGQELAGEVFPALVHVKGGGREHDGHGRYERVFGGQLAVGPQEHAAHDGGGRARKTRPEREALAQAYAQGDFRGNFVQGKIAWRGAEFFQAQHHQRARQQSQGHAGRIEELALDE